MQPWGLFTLPRFGSRQEPSTGDETEPGATRWLRLAANMDIERADEDSRVVPKAAVSISISISISISTNTSTSTRVSTSTIITPVDQRH